MNRLKIVLLAVLAALVGCISGCGPMHYIHTERQLAGYCALETMRLRGLDAITHYDSLVAFTAQAKKAGVTLWTKGDSLYCSAIVTR